MNAFYFHELPSADIPGNQVFAEDEEFVVGQWKKSLEDDQSDDNPDIMMIDSEIGSRFLDAELFGAPCDSPIGPLEEFLLLDKEDQQHFFAPFLPDEDMSQVDLIDDVGMSFEERYKATLKKLAFSMKRSQETRKCLTMKTDKTEKYDRLGSVNMILSSVATSSDQIQNYVTSHQRQC